MLLEVHSACRRGQLQSDGGKKKSPIFPTKLPWQVSNRVLHFCWMIIVPVCQRQYTEGGGRRVGSSAAERENGFFSPLPSFALNSYRTAYWLRNGVVSQVWCGDGQWTYIHQILAGNECGHVVHFHLYMNYVYCGLGLDQISPRLQPLNAARTQAIRWVWCQSIFSLSFSNI